VPRPQTAPTEPSSRARRRHPTWALPTRVALFAVPFLLTPSLGAQQTAGAPTPEPQPAGEEYVIGSGDVLRVFVWKEPDLTRDVTVRLDGKITVPLAGELQAEGRTPKQLASDLEQALGRYLAAPVVTVGIEQAKSSRFYVIGLVQRPGDFPLSGPITVLQGLALAGGFREYAKTDNIHIIRGQGSGQRFILVNYKRLEEGRDASQNVALVPGDTILVP